MRGHAHFADGFACDNIPRWLSYLRGFFGIVETQLRFTEYLHALLQVVGFRHLSDFFRRGQFAAEFRKTWLWASPLTLQSLEGFARYLHTTSAMQFLQVNSLMSLTPAQV